MAKILIRNRLFHSVIAVMIAVILTGFGATLFVNANLGSDTITVFMDGVRRFLSISLGSASYLYNITALILALILSRKNIGWTTIIYALTTGYFMDVFNLWIEPLHLYETNLTVRFLIACLGQGCIVVSFSLLIVFGKGMDQLDAIAYGLTKRIHFSYAFIRTLLDICLLVTGFCMGGVIGVGSLLAMSTTGYTVDWLVKRLNTLNQRRISYERSSNRISG